MKIRAALIGLAMLPVAAFVTAAGPETGTTYYLSCDGTIEGKVKDPLNPVRMTPTAPSGSFTAGDGCGMAEAGDVTGSSPESIYDLAVNDRVTTTIDSLTVELHSIYAAQQRAELQDVRLSVRLTIDGKSPAGNGVNSGTTGDIASPVAFEIDVTPVKSSTGLSEKMEFTITDLGAMFPELNDDPRNRHMVGLTVDWVGEDLARAWTPAASATARNHAYAGAWVWGATEVPASLTFNGAARGTIVSAFDLAPDA